MYLIQVCNTNREYFLKVGNTSSALMFENYLIEMKKDLLVLQNNWRREDEIPKFHYEQKNFSIVETNPELPSNHISVEILAAIDLPYKGDPDTYVKFEFPFPKVFTHSSSCSHPLFGG
jgi:coiled-coil and C2 domain-containing protein 1